MRHLARKKEIINKQEIWSKNKEEKIHFRKASAKEALKKLKFGCGIYSAGSEYGPAVNAALNPLKGGKFIDKLGGCKLLKKHCPLRNQILPLQYGIFLLLGKQNFLLRNTDTEYLVYQAFPWDFSQRREDLPFSQTSGVLYFGQMQLPGVFSFKYVTYDYARRNINQRSAAMSASVNPLTPNGL
jgi:hypothetical protein